MPIVRQLTPALREQAEREIQIERIRRIVTSSARGAGMQMRDLSKRTGIEYNKLMRHLREGKLTVDELQRIGMALRYDPMTYAAICGSLVPCRYEAGGIR